MCSSIEQPVKPSTSSNIKDRTRQSSSTSRQSTIADILSLRTENYFRYGSHAHSSVPRHHFAVQRSRNKPTLRSPRSADNVKRHLKSSSAVDFYFRSLLAVKPFASSLHLWNPVESFIRAPFFPTFNGIARPRPVRMVPHFPAFLPTGNEITGRSELNQQLFNDPVSAFTPNFRWSPFATEYISSSRDYTVKAAEVTSSESGSRCDQPAAECFLPSSLWQPND